MEEQRNKLGIPLPTPLLAYIKHEYPDIGPIIVSTVELTVKESRNHYMDVMRALEPLLKDNTKAFVDKLFMFRKRMCREASSCNKPFCLFAHNDNELVAGNRRPAPLDYTSAAKKFKIDNNEVIINRVDESVHTIDDLKDFSSKIGKVSAIRRLNRGKFLVIFESSDAARRLVEGQEHILNDPEIKKFFNINVPLDQNKNVDIGQLFQDQKDALDRLSVSFDNETLETLKNVTFKIRHHVMAGDRKSTDQSSDVYQKKEEDESAEVENSLYYNMFAG